MSSAHSLLKIHELCVDFPRGGRVVDNVFLDAAKSEIVGLVGESGAGKSMVALSILGLVPAPGAIRSGRVFLRDKELTALDEDALRPLRCGLAGFVFQDPLTSLDPRRRVGSALIESAVRHSGLKRKQARERAVAALRSVELPRPDRGTRAGVTGIG